MNEDMIEDFLTGELVPRTEYQEDINEIFYSLFK